MIYKIVYQVEDNRPQRKEVEAKNLVELYQKLEKQKIGVIKEIKT